MKKNLFVTILIFFNVAIFYYCAKMGITLSFPSPTGTNQIFDAILTAINYIIPTTEQYFVIIKNVILANTAFCLAYLFFFYPILLVLGVVRNRA